MKDKRLTVSDLSQLIAAREETRAELHLLSLEARQHWHDIEARLHELEHRLDLAANGPPPSGEHPVAAACAGSPPDQPAPPSDDSEDS